MTVRELFVAIQDFPLEAEVVYECRDDDQTVEKMNLEWHDGKPILYLS